MRRPVSVLLVILDVLLLLPMLKSEAEISLLTFSCSTGEENGTSEGLEVRPNTSAAETEHVRQNLESYAESLKSCRQARYLPVMPFFFRQKDRSAAISLFLPP
jgi:hypothetical protein